MYAQRREAREKMASAQIIVGAHTCVVTELRHGVSKIFIAWNGSNTQFSAFASKPCALNPLPALNDMADPLRAFCQPTVYVWTPTKRWSENVTTHTYPLYNLSVHVWTLL